MSRPGLVIVFAAVVNTLAVDELAELPEQLRTSDLSILLIPKQWFEGQKGDSDISKLPFSIFCSVSVKVMAWVSIFRPKNSICCDGFRTDSFRFMTKPRC